MSEESRPPAMELPDMREIGGIKDGERQALDRRLFMQLQAFGECEDPAAVIAALETADVDGVLYADLHDPRGVALLTMSEDPMAFVGPIRSLLAAPPFGDLRHRPDMTMFGRTYAIGYEPELEDTLVHRPRRNVLDPDMPWAVWYPLRRRGAFAAESDREQRAMLKEHGTIGMAYGRAGLAKDIRLACHGLDEHDNDFVIALLGGDLAPLSKVVEAMRGTRQTSTYMAHMGPFFVGHALWKSPMERVEG